MSSVFTLLFTPSFLISIQYFDFQTVTLVYILLLLFTLLYSYFKKKKIEDIFIISIYLVLLSLAYITDSFYTVKFIPVLTALTFFTIFAYGAVYKKAIIFNFTKRFYKKDFSMAEIQYLEKGDSYWAFSIFIYSMFLLTLVYYGDDILWAFFSSLGWYIYFLITLSIQILYGKFYAIEMYTK